jgi:hypothetical protein
MKINIQLFASILLLLAAHNSLQATVVSISSISYFPTISSGCTNVVSASVSGCEGTVSLSLSDGNGHSFSTNVGSGGSLTAYFPASGSGTITYTASATDATSVSSNVTAISLSGLQVQLPGSVWVSVPSTLYVLRGNAVTFRALPSSGSFPSGPTWSGSSGASGSGETVAITFNTLSTDISDFKTVVATLDCGAVSQTANVIVYELAGSQVPDENWSGRSLTTFGIGEVLQLSAVPSPADLSLCNVDPMYWTNLTSFGTLDIGDPYTGTATLTGGGCDATTSVQLNIPSGLNQKANALSAAISSTWVRPSSVEYRHMSSTDPIWHKKDWHSVGVRYYLFLLPTTVSFKNISVREGASTDAHDTSTGIWAQPVGTIHQVGSGFGVFGAGVNQWGSVLAPTVDQSAKWNSAASPGTGVRDWTIDIQYAYTGPGTPQQTTYTTFTTANVNTPTTVDAGTGKNPTATRKSVPDGYFSKNYDDATVTAWTPPGAP